MNSIGFILVLTIHIEIMILFRNMVRRDLHLLTNLYVQGTEARVQGSVIHMRWLDSQKNFLMAG